MFEEQIADAQDWAFIWVDSEGTLNHACDPSGILKMLGMLSLAEHQIKNEILRKANGETTAES